MPLRGRFKAVVWDVRKQLEGQRSRFASLDTHSCVTNTCYEGRGGKERGEVVRLPLQHPIHHLGPGQRHTGVQATLMAGLMPPAWPPDQNICALAPSLLPVAAASRNSNRAATGRPVWPGVCVQCTHPRVRRLREACVGLFGSKCLVPSRSVTHNCPQPKKPQHRHDQLSGGSAYGLSSPSACPCSATTCWNANSFLNSSTGRP